MKEVATFKLVTPSAISERLKINGSLARRSIKELLKAGTIKLVDKLAVALLASSTSAFVVPASAPRSCAAASVRSSAPTMDETILEKALAGELEEEGAENVFMSEVGWATYLDKNAGGSYNMNQRPSMADDGYFTPDVFSNPLDVISGWVDSMKGVIADPLSNGFPTISNDQSGARSYPKGATEVEARTIKPKVKDFDPKKRITGIPGFNAFGTPSSKQDIL